MTARVNSAVTETPPEAALLSAVPIALLGYLDRRERESPWRVGIAVLWGALIATGPALPLNTGIIAAVAAWLERHAEVQRHLGPQGALLVGAPLAAPLVEAWRPDIAVLRA